MPPSEETTTSLGLLSLTQRGTVCQHGHAAVLLGAGDPAARRLAPAERPVVGDVVPHQVAARREVRRTLGPPASGEQPLDATVASDTGEALIQHLQVGDDRLHTQHVDALLALNKLTILLRTT
jgi:hypothetical protein